MDAVLSHDFVSDVEVINPNKTNVAYNISSLILYIPVR